MARLAPKMRRFVDAYLGAADGNGAKAAVSAGYSPIGASQTASRLLTRPDVTAAVQRAADKADLSTAKTLERVGKLASATPAKVSDITVLKANELILKVNGALNEKRHDSRIQVNIGFMVNGQLATINATDMQPNMPSLPHLTISEGILDAE